MLNTHKCLLESGVDIQKRLESHPATKKMRIFGRPRSASLGDSPKNQAKGEKRAAPSHAQGKTPKRGKSGRSPSYAQVAKSQALNEEGDWQEVTRKSKKEKNVKKEKAEEPVQNVQGTVARPKLKRSSPARSGDAIKVSARNGQSYTGILREMTVKVDPGRAGL